MKIARPHIATEVNAPRVTYQHPDGDWSITVKTIDDGLIMMTVTVDGTNCAIPIRALGLIELGNELVRVGAEGLARELEA